MPKYCDVSPVPIPTFHALLTNKEIGEKRGERACSEGCYCVKGPVHLWGPVYIVTCQRLHGNLSGPN